MYKVFDNFDLNNDSKLNIEEFANIINIIDDEYEEK